MPTNKDNQKTGSPSSMGSSTDREFDTQGTNPSSGKSGQSPHTGSEKGTGPKGNMDDDEMNTAGGRQGSFSESDRDKEGQWSPGSSQSSDQ